VTEALTLSLPTRRATRRLGAALSVVLVPGDLVVLEGDLGAGKTFLVRGIARGLGVVTRQPVTSPTFTLVNELRARVPLVHADLYRLGQPDELIELGLADRVGRDAIVLVEWGDRFAEALGGEGLWIWLSLTGDGRTARLEGRGARGRDILERLRAHAPELLVAPPGRK
jgi:tRNA threonylcarbamoyladenosine biosynthesis protein TsaE